MTRHLTAIGVMVTLLALSPPVHADFTVCNKTDHPTGVAIGYPNGMTWISEGWWTIAPGACTPLLTGELISRFYYLYAVHYEVGGLWKGDRKFCVSDQSFTIHGRENCAARGYNSSGFIEIDTGLSEDWRQDLETTPPSATQTSH